MVCGFESEKTQIMANRFYQCVCGKFATIDMFEWIAGEQMIECQCGRKLRVKDSFFGFSLDTAQYAWAKYIREESQKTTTAKALNKKN